MIAGTLLESLPLFPATLEHLDLRRCPIRSLPEPLPPRLRVIETEKAALTQPPSAFPDSLERLKVWCGWGDL